MRTHKIHEQLRWRPRKICCVCGLEIGTAALRVRMTDDLLSVVHPADATDSNSVEAWVSPTCCADWPSEFIPKQ